MLQRICVCCKYSCKSGTRTIDLCQNLSILLVSLIGIYFFFMFIGYVEYISGFTWEKAGRPCGNIPELFYLCVAQGLLTTGFVIFCITFLGLLGIGIYKLFKDPCMEMKDNWDKAEYPDYGTLDTKTNIEIVINTTANENN